MALGPLELWHQGRQYDLGPVMHRRVLAVLLHARGEPVSVESLAMRIWEESGPPANSPATLRTYISRLRGRLRAVGEAARLDRPSRGQYRLSVPPEGVDLLRFHRLRFQAREAAERGETERAIGLLRQAELLWRGEPLAEFSGEWAASTRVRLREDLLRVKEQRIGLELNRGRHADLIGELRELVAQNPTAQQAVGYLMRALYRSGRHAESLEVYRSTYRRLGAELGIPPGAELQRLNRQIIEQDPALDAVETPAGPAAARDTKAGTQADAKPGSKGGTKPASESDAKGDGPRTPSPQTGSLPRDTRDFIGRTGELASLLADFASHSSSYGSSGASPDDDTAPPVTVLYGMPGIGKTATAVRAAYRMKERYPDGAYYVDLRGHSEQSRCDTNEALASLLRMSGAATALPDAPDERAARWREFTARHRVLLILDNAHSARQLTPLLPAGPACRAIVTSRVRLAGLDGARPVFLEALSASEAMELFRRVAGAERTSDRAALRRIVDACGRHPLALQLLAGRYRHRESWDLDHLHDRLTRAHDPLEEFDAGLAQAFQLSYAELGDDARRLLRRLALHPGPDTTLGGATALLGEDAAAARRAVEALQDAHLLGETVLGRYRLHDLVRAFALHVCRGEEPEPARRAATRRLITYCLRSADRADRLTHPRRRRLPVPYGRAAGSGPHGVGAEPGGEVPFAVEEFRDADEASVWLEMERANLLAVARIAADEAPHCAAALAHVLAASLKLWGAWEAAEQLHATAIAALRGGEPPGEEGTCLAQALTEHADVQAKGAPQEALRDAQEALALFEERRDPEGCADALFQMGRAQLTAGQGKLCLETLEVALARYRESGSRHGEAEALNVRGVALHLAGRRHEAEACFRAMHHIHRELGDVRGQVRSLNNLGEIHRRAGRHDEARVHYEQSLELVRRIGGRQERANLYNNLGIVCQAAGETSRALNCFHQALNSYRMSHDALGEADTLVCLGALYATSGRLGEALRHYERAGQLARSIGNVEEQQGALAGIGSVQLRLGRHDLAAESYTGALRLAREAGIPLGAAEALEGLARVALATGDADAAREPADEAVRLYESLGERERAAALLADLGPREAAGSGS